MFRIKAQVHSLNDRDDVIILHENGCNEVVAEYRGKRCTAVFNPFVAMYYVDDICGVLSDQRKCPVCGEVLPDTEQYMV